MDAGTPRQEASCLCGSWAWRIPSATLVLTSTLLRCNCSDGCRVNAVARACWSPTRVAERWLSAFKRGEDAPPPRAPFLARFAWLRCASPQRAGPLRVELARWVLVALRAAAPKSLDDRRRGHLWRGTPSHCIACAASYCTMPTACFRRADNIHRQKATVTLECPQPGCPLPGSLARLRRTLKPWWREPVCQPLCSAWCARATCGRRGTDLTFRRIANRLAAQISGVHEGVGEPLRLLSRRPGLQVEVRCRHRDGEAAGWRPAPTLGWRRSRTPQT